MLLPENRLFRELNDAATVKKMFRDEAPVNDPVVERATGWVVGASEARAEFGWAGAKALWRDLEKANPFWKSAAKRAA